MNYSYFWEVKICHHCTKNILLLNTIGLICKHAISQVDDYKMCAGHTYNFFQNEQYKCVSWWHRGSVWDYQCLGVQAFVKINYTCALNNIEYSSAHFR